ncbi:MAG: hypothetical protein NC218_07995 [Acetobacter sp.]|nr:hypothetical protein [Acetobacter sp.]
MIFNEQATFLYVIARSAVARSQRATWQSSGGYMLGVGDPLTAVSQPRDDTEKRVSFNMSSL